MTPESLNDTQEYDIWRGIPVIPMGNKLTVRESHRIERVSDQIIEDSKNMTQCLDVSRVWNYSQRGLDRVKVQYHYLNGNGGDLYFITRGKKKAFNLLKDLGVLEEATIVEPKTNSLRTMRGNFILQKRINGGWGDWFTDIEAKKGRRINLLEQSSDTFPLAETFRIGLEGEETSAKTISFTDNGSVLYCDPSLFERNGLFGITNEKCKESGGIFVINKPGEAITKTLSGMGMLMGYYNLTTGDGENRRLIKENYYKTVDRRKALGQTPDTAK